LNAAGIDPIDHLAQKIIAYAERLPNKYLDMISFAGHAYQGAQGIYNSQDASNRIMLEGANSQVQRLARLLNDKGVRVGNISLHGCHAGQGAEAHQNGFHVARTFAYLLHGDPKRPGPNVICTPHLAGAIVGHAYTHCVDENGYSYQSAEIYNIQRNEANSDHGYALPITQSR
jgi:hypothetical protein